ncbi:MAG: matrixin family metalloprotease [Actinobacteria bacterium]|nr:matrixin family metalloprotease [Actinomycetota bacterium]
MDGDPQDDYFVRVSSLRPEPIEPPPTTPAPARGPSVGSVLAVILGAVVGAVAVVAWAVGGTDAPVAGPPPDGTAGGAVVESDVSTSRETRDPAVDGYGVWARNEDGTPVRWNPCEPIEWVFNPASAPPGVRVDLDRAFGEIAAATGLRFRFAGETDELPERERSPYQPERYGDDGWAPILVAWTAPGDTDVPLTSTDRGVSVPVAVGDGTVDTFVSGQVVFNPQRPLQAGFDDRRTSWGATILHELGHTVGLDHVDDPSQLMYTFPGQGPVRLGVGDRRGLAELGSGGCLDVPDPVDVDVTYVDDFGR